ncbi:AraC family transcriptional regulator [uncultured Mucilaginibacter sp.]|uniref:helix-turn-helix domain-containing protein n=1 Tax=uncultured Mucilaginibacter sp. TaxID=797541 RepID=UPI002626A2D0|nr:AraC family transcriptional regulator [uncultured Mucilaginibacter sp.]
MALLNTDKQNEKAAILDRISQHGRLPLWLFSHHSIQLPKNIQQELNKPVRKNFFFIQLVLKGSSEHRIDWNEVIVSENQILFVTPELIHTKPLLNSSDAEFYKISFGKELLSYFPTLFNFFVNPFDSNIIHLDEHSKERVVAVFKLLFEVIEDKNLETNLVISYLHVLLTECNFAYFKHLQKPVQLQNNLSLFIKFKQYIEESFQQQPTIEKIAQALSINANTLYQLVKNRTGNSPKEFLTNRLILEAKRKLYFTDLSTKELAWSLGYTDPGYFSKLFKKSTGKSVLEYRSEMKKISSNSL